MFWDGERRLGPGPGAKVMMKEKQRQKGILSIASCSTHTTEEVSSPGARQSVRHGHKDGSSPQAGTTLRFSLNSGATANEQQMVH